MTESRPVAIIMMAFRGIVRKLGLRRLLFILIASLFLLLVMHSSFKPNVRSMLELNKCPACYGVSFCSDILQGPDKISIEFDFWGRLGLLANTFTTKNVYSGWYGHQRVIIKRLGHDFELQNMDANICKAMKTENNCVDQMKSVVFRVLNLRNSVERLLNESVNLNDYRLRLCPTTEHVDTLFNPILKINGTNQAKLGNDPFTANIWTLLLINPEPLLLQIMRAEDGWPVPHYLGACGRIAISLNAGEPLIDYHQKSWPERAGLALQLLLAADRFTYSHPRFAFYLLDASADNVVVNDQGKLSFIDLEHFVIVDRHPSHVPDTWNETHFSELYNDCPGCNTFSPYNMCNHHISDHNHFMICQQLLAPGVGSNDNYLPGGLLHSLPPEIRKDYSQIETFLNECSTGAVTDHIKSARRLRDILNIASKESPLFGDTTLVNTWRYF